MAAIPYFVEQQKEQRNFLSLLALGVLWVILGALAFFHMEHHGHIVTGMNNQVVWGVPHVFAIFLIVAASGVLNVASIGSVFGKTLYKTRAPLSGLLSLAMLAGGLAVLMLDLGRPDRLIVAMTHFNFKSVFAWNVFLYTGLFAVVGAYLWAMMDHVGQPFVKPLGFTAFVWRLILTTGTGSIFGFLVARQAYQSAMLAPMFIVMSFAWGLAVFLLVQSSMYRWNHLQLHPVVHRRIKNLLALFVLAVAYFVAVYHLTNLYFARQTAVEHFILLEGGTVTAMFWLGYGLIGTVIPLALLWHPATGSRAGGVVAAASCVVIGAFALLYVFIIGGQAFPLELFPGYTVSSSFYDGAVERYVPSIWEVLLGLGGVALAFLMTTIGVRVFAFLPQDDFKRLEGSQELID